MDNGFALDIAGKLGHRTVERGGEQQHLAFVTGQPEDAPHRR